MGWLHLCHEVRHLDLQLFGKLFLDEPPHRFK